MTGSAAASRLYALTASLLIAHEIDSAYWREWELFGLGGGIGAFVLLHVPLALALFWGFERLLSGTPAGTVMSLLVAAAGLVAPVLHGRFLMAGRPEFRVPVSSGLLLAVGLAAAAQLTVTLHGLRRR